MGLLDKYYYPGVVDNRDLTNVFDFDNFVDHTQLGNVFAVGNRISNTSLNNFIYYMITVYNTTSKQNTLAFIENDFQNALSDYIIVNNIAPALANTETGVFNVSNQTNYNTFVTQNVYAIIKSSSLDWSDLSTIQSQLLALPNDNFSFIKSLAGTQTVDTVAFQQQFAQILTNNLYPAFYYRHITDRIKNCDDFKCKRAYLLARYVFVYYTFMSMFLMIFGSPTTVDKFRTDTNSTNDQLETLKYQIILLMDGILGVLQDENILDAPNMEPSKIHEFIGIKSKKVSDIQGYYEYLRHLSEDNVLKSHYLNEQKKTATIMQNNLSNFTEEEMLSYKRYVDVRRSFIILVVIMFLVISYLITLLTLGRYNILFLTSSIVLLGLAITTMVAVTRQR